VIACVEYYLGIAKSLFTMLGLEARKASSSFKEIDKSS
jgi:hypothetical protein